MNREYWINRWNENQTGFHLKGVNPLLTQFWPRHAAEFSCRCAERAKTLPGWRSEDTRSLVSNSHLIAAKAFAAEQGIVFRRLTNRRSPCFAEIGLRTTSGDFLDFTPAIGGRV